MVVEPVKAEKISSCSCLRVWSPRNAIVRQIRLPLSPTLKTISFVDFVFVFMLFGATGNIGDKVNREHG